MKNITKSHLRTGMTVKLRGFEGLVKVVFGMIGETSNCILIGSNGEHHTNLFRYDYNLNRRPAHGPQYTIEKIWDVPSRLQDFGKPCTDSLVFSRECEMTIVEIEKALGITNLKVVK